MSDDGKKKGPLFQITHVVKDGVIHAVGDATDLVGQRLMWFLEDMIGAHRAEQARKASGKNQPNSAGNRQRRRAQKSKKGGPKGG